MESAVEEVPSTKPDLPENKEEPADTTMPVDTTMKDKEDEEEDDDDDDPETSVGALMD